MSFTAAEKAWFYDEEDQSTTPKSIAPEDVPQAARTMDVQAASQIPQVRYGWDTGEDFFGGLGPVSLNVPDYWTLRARSAHLYQTNLFARGIVRRLVTNTIVTGLHLEAIPNEALLGVPEKSLKGWTEDTEDRFSLWAEEPSSCDAQERGTFGSIQAQIVLEALVGGDCLVTLYGSGKAPKLRVFPGEAVQTPFGVKPRPGHTIEHGVEIDALGRHVAFHVRQKDGSYKRLPAWGEKSGRRLAWLVYGTDKRVDEVRGRPILALTIQSLAELDKYRSSTQRKALLNSILSVWIEKTQDKLSGDEFFNAVGGSKGLTPDATQSTEPRKFRLGEFIPGAIVDQLETGEKMHAHSSNGITESYGDFLVAVVQSVAWSLEIPPEILILSFNKSFSASKAANNEFEVFLFKQREWFGAQCCKPVYQEWLLSETLSGRISAPGLLEAWRFGDAVKYGAWTSSDWSAHVKATVDPVKQMAGFQMMLDAGAVTYDRVARWTSGMKFSRVIKQQAEERKALREALGILPDAPKTDPKLYMVPNDDEDEEEPKKESSK